ncbi:hypothetical protein G6F32_016488 [Rhizopus arrhizus]|nr:hypothetical protein G6F32_016488 [Rhizopus arrhizus]
MRQIHQHPPGHADLGRQARTLGAQWVLDHLDHDGLSLKQQLFDGRGRQALAALTPVFAQVRDMDEGRTFQPDVDESALHARQHTNHPSQIDIADMAPLDAAFHVQLLDGPQLDQRNAGRWLGA